LDSKVFDVIDTRCNHEDESPYSKLLGSTAREKHCS